MPVNGDLIETEFPTLRNLVKCAQDKRKKPIQDVYIRKAEEQLMKWNPSVSSHKGTILAIEGTHPLQVEILNNDENFHASMIDRSPRENTTQWYKENSNTFEDLIKEGSLRVTHDNINPKTTRSQAIDEIFDNNINEDQFDISTSEHTEITLSTLEHENGNLNNNSVSNVGQENDLDLISNNDSFQLTINAPNTCTTPYGEIVTSGNLDHLGGSNPMLSETEEIEINGSNNRMNNCRTEPPYKSLYEKYYRQPIPVNYLESVPQGAGDYNFNSLNSYQQQQQRHENIVSSTIKRWYAMCLTSMSCDQ